MNQRLRGVSSPLGRPPRNREIVSCRACVRARGECRVEMHLKSRAPRFPFSLMPGGLSLFPCEICESVSSCEF